MRDGAALSQVNPSFPVTLSLMKVEAKSPGGPNSTVYVCVWSQHRRGAEGGGRVSRGG